jgi:hypothetical protein
MKNSEVGAGSLDRNGGIAERSGWSMEHGEKGAHWRERIGQGVRSILL